MKFKYFREPVDQIEETGSELENITESENIIFEKEPLIDEMPDYHIPNDDYMLKESERLTQEDLDEMLKPRIP